MANLGGLLNELQTKSNKKKNKKLNKPETNYTDCDVTYIYNALQTSPFSDYYLLIDIRSSKEFNKSCIYHAINLNIDQIDDINQIKKLSEIPCNKPNNLKFIEMKKIIIYHNNKNYKNNNDEKINALKTLFINKEKVTNFRILSTGFDAFCVKYPFFVIPGDSKDKLAKHPHEIIPNRLYLGDGQQATKQNIINNLKITHIANISKEIKCVFREQGIKYIDVQIQDLEEEDILNHIDKVIEFIDNAFNENKNNDDDTNENKENNDNNNRVLVHCEYGISRSSSMVISYLIYKNKWNFETSKKYVKDKRPQISPNHGFVKQLKQYETNILSTN